MTLTHRPVRFCLHVDHLGNARRDVWAVSWRGRYLTARTVDVRVPTLTVFRGADAPQPKAYLTGRGRIAQRGMAVVIS